jgi:hypothetical protein
MSNKIPYRQDLPPSSGYPQVQIKRIPTWTPSGWKLGLAILATVPFAIAHHKYRKYKIQ